MSANGCDEVLLKAGQCSIQSEPMTRDERKSAVRVITNIVQAMQLVLPELHVAAWDVDSPDLKKTACEIGSQAQLVADIVRCLCKE